MSQRRSDLHTLLNFSIYIFPINLYWNRIPVWHKISGKKKLFLIDPHDKGSMSETFDKSQMSESFDVPAGCKRKNTYLSSQGMGRILVNGNFKMLPASHITSIKVKRLKLTGNLSFFSWTNMFVLNTSFYIFAKECCRMCGNRVNGGFTRT